MRHPRRQRAASAFVVVLTIASLGLIGQDVTRGKVSAGAAARVCAAAERGACAPRPAAAEQASAEERLAAKHAPFVELRVQADPCGREAFRPMPVEVVLGNPEVTLVVPGPDGRTAIPAPTAADLYRVRTNRDAYLDLPGNPNTPRCTYASGFRRVAAETPAVTYAHIAQERGYLALQYWLYYYFNDWNNQHESDWEMIQLLFRAGSAAEALEQDPVRVSFAQHSGGETAEWDDPKLERDGDRPIVRVSAGSHASYFEPEIFLGLGENGSGLGCDDASAAAHRVPLEPRLVPATVTGEDDPFAWSVFQGRWGQREPGQNNGPRGPNSTKRWTQPVEHFDEHISDYSVTVPRGRTLGPNAIEVFCDIVSVSGTVLSLFYQSPLVVTVTAGAFLAAFGGFMVVTSRRTFFRALAGAAPAAPGARARARLPVAERSAVAVYAAYPRVFIAIGAIFVPIGLLGSVLTDDVIAGVGDVAIGAGLLGGLPLLAAFVVVNAAVAATIDEMERGAVPGILSAYRAVWEHLAALTWARVKAFVVVTVLAATLVGIPLAVDRAVRWLFIEQTVLLDGAGSGSALKASARAVQGRWWRTCATAVVLGLAGLFTGPVVALLALLIFGISGDSANLLSSAVCALILPLVFIALTLFYRDLKAGRTAAGG